MTRFPLFEVAISDADRAEIEILYIELMRERDDAQAGSPVIAAQPSPSPTEP